MFRLPSLRAATLCAVLSVCFGCSTPRPVPTLDLLRAPEGAAAGTFELTVSYGEIVPAADAPGAGTAHVPIYHEALSPVLPSPWVNGSDSRVHAFMITGEERSLPWVLVAAETPIRALVTSQTVLQPIVGEDLFLRVRAEAKGLQVVAVDADGVELDPGFLMPRGGYLWVGSREGWNEGGVAGTLIAVRPTATPSPSR